MVSSFIALSSLSCFSQSYAKGVSFFSQVIQYDLLPKGIVYPGVHIYFHSCLPWDRLYGFFFSSPGWKKNGQKSFKLLKFFELKIFGKDYQNFWCFMLFQRILGVWDVFLCTLSEKKTLKMLHPALFFRPIDKIMSVLPEQKKHNPLLLPTTA